MVGHDAGDPICHLSTAQNEHPKWDRFRKKFQNSGTNKKEVGKKHRKSDKKSGSSAKPNWRKRDDKGHFSTFVCDSSPTWETYPTEYGEGAVPQEYLSVDQLKTMSLKDVKALGGGAVSKTTVIAMSEGDNSSTADLSEFEDPLSSITPRTPQKDASSSSGSATDDPSAAKPSEEKEDYFFAKGSQECICFAYPNKIRLKTEVTSILRQDPKFDAYKLFAGCLICQKGDLPVRPIILPELETDLPAFIEDPGLYSYCTDCIEAKKDFV